MIPVPGRDRLNPIRLHLVDIFGIQVPRRITLDKTVQEALLEVFVQLRVLSLLYIVCRAGRAGHGEYLEPIAGLQAFLRRQGKLVGVPEGDDGRGLVLQYATNCPLIG